MTSLARALQEVESIYLARAKTLEAHMDTMEEHQADHWAEKQECLRSAVAYLVSCIPRKMRSSFEATRVPIGDVDLEIAEKKNFSPD